MAFILKRHINGINYYSLVESYRAPGERHPRHRQLEWLGNYDEAIAKLEQSTLIPSDERCKHIESLKKKEGCDTPASSQAKQAQPLQSFAPGETQQASTSCKLTPGAKVTVKLMEYGQWRDFPGILLESGLNTKVVIVKENQPVVVDALYTRVKPSERIISC